MAPSTPNPDAIFDALIQNRRDPASLRKRIETLEMLLERSFVIPGINRPVGLDAIVGLVPGTRTFAAAVGPAEGDQPQGVPDVVAVADEVLGERVLEALNDAIIARG